MDTRYINIPVIYKLFIPRQKEFYRNFVNRFPPMFIVSMTKSAFKRLNTGQTFFFFFHGRNFAGKQTERRRSDSVVQSFIVQSVASCLHPIKLISGHADRGILPCYYRCASRASMIPLTDAFPLPDQSNRSFSAPIRSAPGHTDARLASASRPLAFYIARYNAREPRWPELFHY